MESGVSRTPALERDADTAADGRRPLSARQIAVRLFATCWIVYALHFATNIVREIYPALALGDHFSFRVDEYANLHPDLFETPGFGWHINNNPGVSMVAAIPYALARPLIDPVVRRVLAARAASGQTQPPAFSSPWPMARDFYAEAWRRGFDVKFGLGALVMQVFSMAPSSALGVVVMFFVLRHVVGSDRQALWLSLVYAFGTPVFFRTGYLNQNMMLGHIAFAGFVAIWNPGSLLRWSAPARYLLGGLAGGLAFLFDYSGVVLLVGLGVYGIAKAWREREVPAAIRYGALYAAGAVPPVLLLWFYQWRAFGHPFYPAQHWMPRVAWIERGYQGASGPQPDLLWALGFDLRFGLFVTAPVFLLALAAPFVLRRWRTLRLPMFELAALLGLAAGLWVFLSGIHYTRLQFNTGIRHLAPAFPLLFVAAAIVLARLPRPLAYFIAVGAVAQAWCMAMYRDVERGSFGVLDPVLQTFIGGFQLPVLSTLSNIGGPVAVYFPDGVSPLPLMALAAAIIYGVWAIRGEDQASLSR